MEKIGKETRVENIVNQEKLRNEGCKPGDSKKRGTESCKSCEPEETNETKELGAEGCIVNLEKLRN